MSNEFRKAMLNRLPAPATRAPWAEPDEDEDEAEELDDLGDLGPRPSGSSKLTPLSAAEFFQQALEVDAPGRDATFRVYLTAPVESQAGASSQSKKTYLVAHHGAGASGLSFAPLAKEVARVDPELGMVAFDARGHGECSSGRIADGTGKTRADNVDLSLDTLTADLVAVIEHMFPDPAVSLLLVGHSMGAAPILAAAPLLQAKGYTVPGVVVLDVVEGELVVLSHADM
jgi:protein phosphatase methylesterase 1